MLPPSATSDARRLLATRALRGFADGLVSVLLADYLSRLGLSPRAVGAIVTGTLLGSAALVIAAGLLAHQMLRRRLLLYASLLMAATGVGFAGFSTFWPLLAVAIVGTLNPSAGDVSVFLPTETAVLAQTVDATHRTLLYAWYNVIGTLFGAAGALASGLPEWLAHHFGTRVLLAERAAFGVYVAVAVAIGLVYRRLSSGAEVGPQAPAPPLLRSRAVVLRLAALFSLDSFGGGFAVQSLVVLWLYRRFALSAPVAGAVFAAAGVLGAISQFVSARIAARIGLIRTMVFTHLPSNVFLILCGLAPTAPLAIALLLLRASLSQMDVPARQSYVMAVVPPEERAAASSITNVPRSLAAAIPPLLTGWMLERSSVGWPLVTAGVLKAIYDLLLWAVARETSEPRRAT
jgi:MFS family permease